MFTDFIASDAQSSTKTCRRHTNYVHPLKYEMKDDRNLTFRVMNYGLLKLKLYSWYTCCFKEPVFDILCFAFLCFSYTKEWSLHQSVSTYMCIHWQCVSSIRLVTPSSIEYSYLFAHAQEIGWTLILMSNKSSTCTQSKFCTRIDQHIHRYLSN